MKRFLVIFSLSLLIFQLFLFPSFAYFNEYSIDSDTSWADIPAVDYPSSDRFSEALAQAILSIGSSVSGDPGVISDVSIMPLYNLDNGSTNVNVGLRAVMRNLIGPYSPVVVQYQYTNGTNTQYLREILPDYEWMFNFGLFALVLYCVFRMGGAFLCRR